MVKSHSRNHKKIFKYEESRGNFDRRRGNGHQNHDHHSHHDGSRSSKGAALLTHRNVPDSRRTNSDTKNDSSLVNRLDLPKNISPSILDFFHRIGQRLRNRHRSGDLPIDTNNNDDLTLWKQSWAAAAVGAGDLEQLSFITQALLRLPDSANVTPPCEEIIAILQRIVMCTLDDVKKSSRRSDSNSVQFAISNLECIIDIIRDRLTSKMSTILDPQTIIETVEGMHVKFRGKYFILLHV